MKEREENRTVSVLVVDKTAVLPSVRDRWNRVASQRGIDVTLLAPSAWIENYRRYHFEPCEDHAYRSVRGTVWPVGRELLAFYLTGLRKAFKIARPDVIVMMEESFSVFGLQIEYFRSILSPGVPLVFYNNNISSYQLPGFRLSRLYRWIGQRVTPRCSLGLNVNERARRVLEEGGFGVPSEVVYYGTDERRFVPGDKRLARRELGQDPDTFQFVYIGRLLEGKGIQDLVSAFSRVVERTQRDDLNLLIVGDGPYRNVLEDVVARASASGQIRMKKGVAFDDVPQHLRSADVMVLPTRPELDEQFGRINVESMLVGTTVIGSTCGGIPDVIGEDGYLFEAGNVSDLMEKMITVLENPKDARRRAEKARERGLRLFSVDAFVQSMVRIIRNTAQ